MRDRMSNDRMYGDREARMTRDPTLEEHWVTQWSDATLEKPDGKCQQSHRSVERAHREQCNDIATTEKRKHCNGMVSVMTPRSPIFIFF